MGMAEFAGEDQSVSIVRIGLGETQGYNDGYAAIFGKKKAAEKPAEKPAPEAKQPEAKKVPKKK